MIFKMGRVTECNAAKATVRVVFADYGDLASFSLPVLQHKTLSDKSYWMPDVDEFVVCLLDEHAEAGVVIGAIYSAADAPPIANLDKVHIRFKDGTEIEYDRAAHKLLVSLEAAGADVELSTTRNVTVTSEGGDVTVNVADGHKVILGGAAAAQQLATKHFVTSVYEMHKHVTPSGLSGPPIPIVGETAWPNITDKAVAQ
jgi:phage baseplate assembly protein V